MMDKVKPTKITIEYENGTTKKLTKGVVAHFEGDTMNLDMAQFEKTDLVRLTYGLICALHQMGLSETLVAYTKGELNEKN